MLTYFYARKDWKTYSKANLWGVLVILLKYLPKKDCEGKPNDSEISQTERFGDRSWAWAQS